MDYDSLIKKADDDYKIIKDNLIKQKEELLFSNKVCYYIYNNCVYNDFELLKTSINYDKIDKFFLKGICYYKCCLNESSSVQKYFC